MTIRMSKFIHPKNIYCFAVLSAVNKQEKKLTTTYACFLFSHVRMSWEMILDEFDLFLKHVIRDPVFFHLSLCLFAILILLYLMLMFLPHCPKVVARISYITSSFRKRRDRKGCSLPLEEKCFHSSTQANLKNLIGCNCIKGRYERKKLKDKLVTN